MKKFMVLPTKEKRKTAMNEWKNDTNMIQSTTIIRILQSLNTKVEIIFLAVPNKIFDNVITLLEILFLHSLSDIL